jgi:hypothetical protein
MTAVVITDVRPCRYYSSACWCAGDGGRIQEVEVGSHTSFSM